MNTTHKHIDTWNLLVNLRDTTTNNHIKEKCEMFLRQINTSAGNRVKDEANTFLQSCNALPVIFETGATSHAVNDLILFTETTRELAHSRDIIYDQIRAANIIPKHFHFNDLLTLSINSYVNTLPGTHWQTTVLSESQKKEFCQSYVNDFKNWKSEHGYK